MIHLILRYLRKYPALRFLGIVGLTLSAILLTLIPSDHLAPAFIWSFDKLGHILLFGFWTFLLGLHRYFENPDSPNLGSVFLTGVLFGGLIEVLQYILPVNRSAELLDWGCDIIGALGAILILRLLFNSSIPDQ